MALPTPEEMKSWPPSRFNRLHLQKHYPDLVSYLEHQYPGTPFPGALYLYRNSVPTAPICPTCGKPVPYLSAGRGFQEYCSISCAASSPTVQEKSVRTCQQRYGADHPAQNATIKGKIVRTCQERHGGMGNASLTTQEAFRSTMKEKYGAENALQVKEIKEKAVDSWIQNHGGIGRGAPQVRSRIDNTCQDRYGGEVLANPLIRHKIQGTNIKRYGYPVASSSSVIAQKISDSKSKSFAQYHADILKIEKTGNDIMYTCACPHPSCSRCEEKCYVISAPRYCNRKLDGTEPCTRLLPVLPSRTKNTSLELKVQEWLSELTDPSTLRFHHRGLIGPQEIDIYDPIHRIAVEINGCYWHSEQNKGSTYHYQKWKKCEGVGVQLITLWEDWIRNKPEIVKSLLSAKYHVFHRSIYARECQVELIAATQASRFYQENHIQGPSRARYHYGLVYKGELVCAMSFSPLRGCVGDRRKDNSWELVRFCSALFTQVSGGAARLLSHFQKDHPEVKLLVSYSSHDISDGNVYKILGFHRGPDIRSSYWYIGRDYQRFHRSSFTKKEIIRKGMAPQDLRKHWTEQEMMMEHGFVKIYDSGLTRWELHNK